MKGWRTILAVLLAACMLVMTAAADNTVEHTMDEDGHDVTIVTDENGNQTVITEVEPGDDDITFDEGELDLDDEEMPEESAMPEQSGVDSENHGGASWWIAVPIVIACAAVAVWLLLRGRKNKA